MTEFRWAEAADYQNIIEEANHAFDPAHYTGDFEKDTSKESFFPRILPKLYQNPRIAPMHVLAIEDGRICGLVGTFELPYVVHGMPLHVVGIGTVSVRPGYRRKGYMKELMARAIQRAKDEQADYMILGGRRQRYGHWGFEQAGAMAYYDVDTDNVRHTYGEHADFGYRFRRLTAKDEEAIQMERKLREAAEIHMIYPEREEYDILCSMGAIPYLIEKNGSFFGTFMYFKQEKQVCDLRIIDKNEVGYVVNDLFHAFLENELNFSHFGPEEQEMMTILSTLAEGTQIRHAAMIKILNYERVLRAYFSLAADLRELQDGELRVAFENGERLLLSVQYGKAEVRRLEADSAEDPDTASEQFLTLTEKEAIQLMFHPHTYLHSFGKPVPAAVRTWFPLPFFEYNSDEI